MAMEVLQMILRSTLALQDILSSSRVMIMKLLLLLLLHSKSQIMPILGMILRLGLVIHPGSKLHLGQKPKLGGVIPTSFTHICIIFGWFFVYPCFTFFCCFSSLFSFLFVLSLRLLIM